MSDLNNKNATKESAETSPKDQQNRIMDEFVSEFVDSMHAKKDTDEAKFNAFVDDILNTDNPNLDTTFATELQTFRARSNKYRHLDVSKLNKFDFQSAVLSSANKLLAERDALFSQILSSYNLSVEQKADLKKGIKGLKLAKITSLFKSEKARDELMKDVFKDHVPSKISHKDFFSKLKIDFDKLPKDLKDALIFFRDEGKIDEKDFSKIISHSFSVEQKRNLIAMFMPVISLGKLVDLKILKKDEAYKRLMEKFDAEYPHIKTKYPDDKARLAFFSQRFNLDDIRVSVNANNELGNSGITLDDKAVDKILKDAELTGGIVTELEKTTKEAAKSDDINSLADFTKNLSGDADIQKKLPGIERQLSNGKVFSIPYDAGGETKNAYVIIDKIDDKGVTLRTLNYADGILDPGGKEGIVESKTLREFTNFISNIPKESKILDKGELKALIKDKGLHQYAAEEKIDTIEQLESLINAQDPQGTQFKLNPGTAFTYTVGGETLSARIKKVTSSGIAVDGAVHDHVMCFSDFYQAFVQSKAKRVGKISNITELMDKLRQGSFKNVVFENGRLYPDNPNLKGTDKGEIKYLKGSGDMCAKIERFDDGKIVLIEGKLDEKEGSDGKITKKILKPKKVTLREDEFLMHAEKLGYKPMLGDDHVFQEKPKTINKKSSTNFGTWLFSNHSLITIAAGGKQWFKAISDGLKEGNDLLAAQLALTLGKPIPNTLKHDLINRVESAQKKLMDDIVGRLNIKRVMEIVQTRNASQPDREAAMMWTLGKYGQLYGEDLIEFRGSFMWYEFMGGKIGDEIYNKYMNDQKKDPEKPTQIVEEDMILDLLKAQGKGDIPPKRRLNFFKEAKAKIKSGKDEKDKDGLEDSKKLNTFAGKLELCKKFLKEGDYYALKGAFPDLVGKGDTDPKLLSEIPFAIVMSGTSKTWHQDLANAFKGVGAACSIPILECAASPADVDMFGRATVALAHTISKDAGREAEKIEEMKLQGKPEKKIVEACFKFWKDHGSKMIGKFQMTTDMTMLVLNDPNVKQFLGKAKTCAGKHEIKDEHRKNDVYNADHSFLMAIGGKEYVRKSIATFNQSNNVSSELESKVIESMGKQLDFIINMEAPGPDKASPEQTKAYRIKAYKHLAKILIDAFTDKFANAQDIDKVKETTWYQDLGKKIPLPTSLDEKNNFKKPTYLEKLLNQRALEFLGYTRKIETSSTIYGEGIRGQNEAHSNVMKFDGPKKTSGEQIAETKKKVSDITENQLGIAA